WNASFRLSAPLVRTLDAPLSYGFHNPVQLPEGKTALIITACPSADWVNEVETSTCHLGVSGRRSLAKQPASIHGAAEACRAQIQSLPKRAHALHAKAHLGRDCHARGQCARLSGVARMHSS